MYHINVRSVVFIVAFFLCAICSHSSLAQQVPIMITPTGSGAHALAGAEGFGYGGIAYIGTVSEGGNVGIGEWGQVVIEYHPPMPSPTAAFEEFGLFNDSGYAVAISGLPPSCYLHGHQTYGSHNGQQVKGFTIVAVSKDGIPSAVENDLTDDPTIVLGGVSFGGLFPVTDTFFIRTSGAGLFGYGNGGGGSGKSCITFDFAFILLP